jgi:hypothetical protein
MTFDLKSIGRALEPREVQNVAICLDLVSVWASEPDKAQLFRICAAAIGCGIDHTARLPKYRYLDGNVLEYGGRLLERLLEAGVTPTAIVEYGTHVIAKCIDKIPSDAAVEEQADFLATPPAAD